LPAKGASPALEIVETVRELLEVSPLRSQPARPEFAPVWVPRSQSGYLVLTCTECLRSFSVPQRKLEEGRRFQECCAHCGMNVQYCLDASAAVEPAVAPTSRLDQMRQQLESGQRTMARSNQRMKDATRRSS